MPLLACINFKPILGRLVLLTHYKNEVQFDYKMVWKGSDFMIKIPLTLCVLRKLDKKTLCFMVSEIRTAKHEKLIQNNTNSDIRRAYTICTKKRFKKWTAADYNTVLNAIAYNISYYIPDCYFKRCTPRIDDTKIETCTTFLLRAMNIPLQA